MTIFRLQIVFDLLLILHEMNRRFVRPCRVLPIRQFAHFSQRTPRQFLKPFEIGENGCRFTTEQRVPFNHKFES